MSFLKLPAQQSANPNSAEAMKLYVRNLKKQCLQCSITDTSGLVDRVFDLAVDNARNKPGSKEGEAIW